MKTDINILRNIQLTGAENRPFLLDFYCRLDNSKKPIIIFTHGFKGFKDYGAWDLVAKEFAENGFAFIKYNLSHNGTTLDQPTDFADLEAFGNNNFSKELDDLGTVIDWVANGDVGIPINELKRRKIYLIGHSRGGATTLLKAAEDSRIKKFSTWAGVSSLEGYWANEEAVAYWKKQGVHYVVNGRTKQEMPLYFQLYKDYKKNKKRLSLERNIPKINAKGLIVHGMSDETVPWRSAKIIADNNPKFKSLFIAGMEHGLGAKHPWEEEKLPSQLKHVVKKCMAFFNSKNKK